MLRGPADAGRPVIASNHDVRLLPTSDVTIDLVPRLGDDAVPSTTELEAGDVLSERGDMAALVHVVESHRIGLVRAFVDGPPEPIAVRGPGEHVGEQGPMLGPPRSATASAVERTTVRSMSLQELRRRSPPTTTGRSAPT